MEFDTLRMARLAFGLWLRCGPFNHPEEGTGAVPTEIATEGKAEITAYLRVGNGFPSPREAVADRMGVSPSTVSNYCSDVRWSPARNNG